MLLVSPTVWNRRRKFMGNFVPALFWFPLALAGVAIAVIQGQFIGLGLWFLVASTFVGWLAVNFFGYYENQAMRRQLERILKVKETPIEGEFIFVGFASPNFSSMVDAHEDVGFLRILDDRITFVSETRTMEIMRADITGAKRRFNVHSLVGLGGWVGIDAKIGERQFRMLVEPREKATMLGSKPYAGRLIARIQEWKKPEK